jgi:uncharacterized iron-regulated membrane protein
VHRPQRLWLRRALFQIHLWTALAIGLYIVAMSVSGSAIVFRRELSAWLVPRSVPTVGMRLEGDALRLAVARAFPDHEITELREQRRADRPVFLVLERDGVVSERLFDPYRGADLGASFPATLRVLEWLVDLHDNLLTGRAGRAVNGGGAALNLVLLATGAVIWWQGRTRWRHSVVLSRPVKSRRFVWQLHSFVGFWAFAMLFVWAATGVYFAFPEPFEATIDRFDPDLNDAERPGETLLLALIQLHFGRFGGLEIRVLWTLLGLLPAVLFLTGFLLWWTRVVRRTFAR